MEIDDIDDFELQDYSTDSSLLSKDKMNKYYQKHLTNNSVTTIHISRVNEKFISGGEINRSQFEKGLAIHRKLQNNFKSSKWVTDKSIWQTIL